MEPLVSLRILADSLNLRAKFTSEVLPGTGTEMSAIKFTRDLLVGQFEKKIGRAGVLVTLFFF